MQSAKSKRYWSIPENQKIFLDSFAKTIGIQKLSDWGNVTTNQLRSHGGSSLLKKYNNSLDQTLRSVLGGK